MNIATAKEQIKNAVRIYLQKNEDGSYQIPVVHQRPVFVMGPPGLGKTAIMQQIADEMGLGLVSYSMTHHTRQSALGLPVIVDREFDGTHYQVSEYTMSEILASVYDCMRETGKREGILFLDEINCVSETLSPAMLLFLQYKVFGGHQVPPGWVIVTAGNPPRFNKSAHELDAATRMIRYHEMLGIPVTDALVSQYLQDPDTARDFALYYQLYQKYKKAWQTDRILQGLYDEEVLDEAKEARTDERITLVGLLLEQVTGDMDLCVKKHDDLAGQVAALKAQRAKMDARAAEEGLPSETEWTQQRDAVRAETAQLQSEVARTQQEIGNMLRFLKDAFGKGLELSIAVNDLSVSRRATAFIGQFLSMDYFEESRELLLHKREEDLLREIRIEL